MEGRIINRTLLQRAADFLNLEGIKRFPAMLDLNDIKAVYDISRAEGVAAPGGGSGTLNVVASTSNAIETYAAPTCYLVSSFQIAPFLGGVVPLASDVAYRFDAIDVLVTFDAAGAAAFNGKQIELDLFFFNLAGDPPVRASIVNLRPWATIQTAKLSYVWTLSGWNNYNGAGPLGQSATWNGRVEKSTVWGLGFGITVTDGTVFPQNTTCDVFAVARGSTNGAVPNN